MKKYYSALAAAVTFFIIYFMFLHGIQPVKYDIQPGGISPEDIYAGREVVNRIATEQLQGEAEREAVNKYIVDNEITQQCQRSLADVLIEISDFKTEYAKAETEDEKNALLENSRIELDKELLKNLALLSDSKFNEFRSNTAQVQKTILNKGVLDTGEAVQSAEDALKDTADTEKAAAVALIKQTVKVNKSLDNEATEAERERLRSSVPSVVYKENQIIVRKGEVITEEQFAVLSDLGLVKGSAGVGIVQGIGMFSVVLSAFIIIYTYLKSFLKEYISKTANVLFLCTVSVINTGIAFLGAYESFNIYVVPIIIGAVLVAILADARLGILLGSIFVVFAGLIFKANVYYFVACMLSCVCGVFVYIKAGMRKSLAIAALVLCGINFAVYFSVGLVEGIGFSASLIRGLYGSLSGVITSVLIIGTLPFWENAFDIATPYKLIELSDSKQPLLKRLIMEAPGTYHHSLMVGNLAEAAAEAVGGNPLLARVGAYYHDIGKLQNPIMFKENQLGENAHDKMAPELSASVIISHVTYGVELAKKHKLPPVIRSIIETHHGNTLVAYFYHKAKQQNEDVQEEKFRYSRKKPKTAEQAIVMLADSVEAAVRSMDEKDEVAVANMVRKIIDGKLSDSQLSESRLTLADIDTISNTFVKTLGGYFHSRIKYPSDNKEEQ